MRISDWSSDVCSSDLGRLWKYVFGYLDVRAESYAEKPRSRNRRRAGFWARALRRRFPVFPTMMRNLAIRAQEGAQMDSPDLPEPVSRERSEASRVGRECVRTCRSRWARSHEKKKP